MIANNKVKCGILNFAEARPGLRNSNSINTKFGGQPDWLKSHSGH